MTNIEGIRERCEKATPGPWSVDCMRSNMHIRHSGIGWPIAGMWAELRGRDVAKDDADFIAHAREDIPVLLAEVARLTDERDAAVRDMGHLAHEHGSCFGCKWANRDYLRCDKPDDRMLRGEKCFEWRGAEGKEDTPNAD